MSKVCVYLSLHNFSKNYHHSVNKFQQLVYNNVLSMFCHIKVQELPTLVVINLSQDKTGKSILYPFGERPREDFFGGLGGGEKHFLS
jgi:hypothetical protein